MRAQHRLRYAALARGREYDESAALLDTERHHRLVHALADGRCRRLFAQILHPGKRTPAAKVPATKKAVNCNGLLVGGIPPKEVGMIFRQLLCHSLCSACILRWDPTSFTAL